MEKRNSQKFHTQNVNYINIKRVTITKYPTVTLTYKKKQTYSFPYQQSMQFAITKF